MLFPELLLTCRHNCPIHFCPLHAYADPYPHPALTKKQEFTFTPDQSFTKLVNHTIALKKDNTLQAEVVCYHALNMHIHNSTLYITKMWKDLFKLQKQHHNSVIALTEANAYNRLAPKVIFKDPPVDFMTTEEIRSSHNTFNNPWVDRPCIQFYACSWCG
jgi:hypothetical protein